MKEFPEKKAANRILCSHGRLIKAGFKAPDLSPIGDAIILIFTERGLGRYVELCAARISGVCGIDIQRTSDAEKAHAYAGFGVIDGLGGTLGWATLGFFPNAPKEHDLMIDKDDWKRMSVEDRHTLVAHEILHLLGFDHVDQRERSILTPFFTSGLGGKLYAPEIKLLKEKYKL